MRLSSSLQILRPCSHSLSRRLLFWITYITTDITFFPFYIDFLFLTSIQLIITPSLSRWMWLFPHIRRNPEWLTSHTEVSNRKREREWSSNLISLDFIFIHIHTETLSHTMILYVWPRGDRCMTVPIVPCHVSLLYHVSDGMWWDTERIQWQ